MKKFTKEQQQVIDFRGRRLLVSASAGTGKTTVMIQRILSLIADGADISQFVVVTFTNLAAAEMKARLARELAAVSNDRRMVEQLEKLDNANISTIHSFCSELLRNYFYLVDIDPGFAIPDNVTVANLKKAVLDEMFAEYFASDDEIFAYVHKIFSKNRQEDRFKQTVLSLYEFARGLENFEEWYLSKRQNFVEYSADNPLIKTLLCDITTTCVYVKNNFAKLAKRCDNEGLTSFAEICRANADLCGEVKTDNLQSAVDYVCVKRLVRLPSAGRGKKAATNLVEIDEAIEKQIRADFDTLLKTYDDMSKKYQKLFRGMSVDELWQQNVQTAVYTDKLVEVVTEFERRYFSAKKQRGYIDFGDLEHLALAILRMPEVRDEIAAKYRYVFVDEYQDTSPIQEEIVKALSDADLFMVGDVKQSIYGFRGCEPEIFLAKYNRYKSGDEGTAVRLNTNFRTNNEIFDFVNDLFSHVMTADFGRVDYRNDAMLEGPNLRALPLPSVQVNLVCPPKAEKPKVEGMYDITHIDKADEGVTQAKIIAANVSKFVGTRYTDGNGEHTISYGDIVVLTRSLKDKATDIYDALVEANIPVVANFKVDGYASKEVRDLVNLLRMLDNPYNDVYTVGVCLSCFGKFTEAELGTIRLDTAGRVPFYKRLRDYARDFDGDKIAQKINTLLEFVDKVRFYSVSSTVCETLLYVMKLTDYELYVSGLPNGGLRVRKLYGFIESVRGAAYAESVDKFLEYIDESDDNAVEEGVGNADAVRIMTMHASKGLEFPIVIVAATETRFNLSPEAVERNVELGLAINYYDFDTMRVSGSIGATACGMFNKTKQREEEMRLLYVALTRAKYMLNVVGNVTEKQLSDLPKQPQKAMSHMDWIMSMLRSNYAETEFATDKLTVEVNRELPECEVRSAAAICRQYTDKQAVLDKMNYVYRFSEQVDMPLKVVSSALDKEALAVAQQADEEEIVTEVLVDDYMPEEEQATKTSVTGKKNAQNKIPQDILDKQTERNKVGSAYHKVLQYVPLSATERQICDVFDKLVSDETLDKKYADEVSPEVVCRIVNDPSYLAICTQGKAYRELPFMLSAPYNALVPGSKFTDDVMLQGVIDLLVVDGTHATVVDYKYTKHSDTVKERYAAQLNSYVMAVKQIFGIDDVDCYILSIADGKLLKL